MARPRIHKNDKECNRAWVANNLDKRRRIALESYHRRKSLKRFRTKPIEREPVEAEAMGQATFVEKPVVVLPVELPVVLDEFGLPEYISEINISNNEET